MGKSPNDPMTVTRIDVRTGPHQLEDFETGVSSGAPWTIQYPSARRRHATDALCHTLSVSLQQAASGFGQELMLQRTRSAADI